MTPPGEALREAFDAMADTLNALDGVLDDSHPEGHDCDVCRVADEIPQRWLALHDVLFAAPVARGCPYCQRTEPHDHGSAVLIGPDEQPHPAPVAGGLQRYRLVPAEYEEHDAYMDPAPDGEWVQYAALAAPVAAQGLTAAWRVHAAKHPLGAAHWCTERCADDIALALAASQPVAEGVKPRG